MKWVLVGILGICYVLFDVDTMGYSSSSKLYTHVTYMFSHVNVFHLLMNALSLICAWRMCSRLKMIREAVVVSFVAAILGSFVHVGEALTVGFSGVIYGMLSCVFGGLVSGRVKVNDSTLFGCFTLAVVLSLVFGFFMPGINGMIHASSFVIGATLLYLYYLLRRLIAK
jgi:membrane associated rhomboid family serine protease